MQPYAVAHFGFDGMAESVAEIKPCADALLGFVLGNNIGLHFAAMVNGFCHFFLVLCHQVGHIFFQPSKKFGIAQCAVFDNFGHACGKFALRQRLQGSQIGQNGLRLVERANHVFTERMVDGGFTADRGIDLAEQCGRHLDKRCATLISRSGKTDHIAYHAAAQSD